MPTVHRVTCGSCQKKRLVLVVDGLDEDRGVKAGAEIHSIASLLPHVPPAGMRVIVTGRPNPPIPASAVTRPDGSAPRSVNSSSPNRKRPQVVVSHEGAQAWATALGRSAMNPEQQTRSLIEAALLVAAGDPARAARLVSAITDPHRRARVRAALTTTVRSVDTKRLIAWGFRLLHWTEPLNALAHVEPGLVGEVVAEYTGINGAASHQLPDTRTS